MTNQSGSSIKLDNAHSIESFVSWLSGISRLASTNKLSIKLPKCWKSVDIVQFGGAQVAVHSKETVVVVFEHSLGKFEWEFAVIKN